MAYKDGKTEPKKGDKVLGDKLKGEVTAVSKDGKVVSVTSLAPYNLKRPLDRKPVTVERAAEELELLYRKP